MRRRDLLRTAASAPLAFAAQRALAQNRRFEPTWASLDARPSPAWHSDGKFGIFIHWGLYSVPAYAPLHSKGETMYAEWYWNSLTRGKAATTPNGPGTSTWNFHKRVYGADFEYKDFAPMFKCEFYDPNHWADIFARSGAKYVALTSKHHEGFTLWPNSHANKAWNRPWNAVDAGPKRDIALELMEAGRRKNLRMGIYYSLYEWYNPLWLADRKRYAIEHMHPQFKDAVTHLKPSIIFSDGEWDINSDEWRSPELLAWLFNESPVKDEVVIDDRWGKDTRHKHGGYYTTEYTSGMQQAAHPWEESRGMGFSYGYNRNEKIDDYHTGRELIMMLVDIVSRGGNLLLDIGPTGDGQIPPIMEQRLLEIGEFLKPNGEAIYGTHAHTVSRQWSAGNVPKLEVKEFMADYPIQNLIDTPREGFARIDAFFTAKGNAVYAILPRRPVGQVTLNGITGTKVTLLENGASLESTRQGTQLRVRVPEAMSAALPHREAYVLKIV